jgi:hypothetical protein
MWRGMAGAGRLQRKGVIQGPGNRERENGDKGLWTRMGFGNCQSKEGSRDQVKLRGVQGPSC